MISILLTRYDSHLNIDLFVFIYLLIYFYFILFYFIYFILFLLFIFLCFEYGSSDSMYSVFHNLATHGHGDDERSLERHAALTDYTDLVALLGSRCYR
jgi:fatty acid desaturase